LIELDKKERLNMLQRVEKEIARVSKSKQIDLVSILPLVYSFFSIIASSPAQLKVLHALKFDLQVKAELNEPEVQKNFKLGNSKHRSNTHSKSYD
jgi:large subunit ribosomal protein L35